MPGPDMSPSPGLVATARSLAVDAVTAEVVAAFEADGIATILLKGPTLVPWLYDDGAARYYMDSDLLVPPARLTAAEATLGRLGFARRPTPDVAPSREPPHSQPWIRVADRAEIDLHRTLFGLGVSPEDAWREVSRTAETIRLAGAEVNVLDARGRTLLVALHAAQHGEDKKKPIEDLRRALERTPEEMWREVAALAADLHAAQNLATGLRLLPSGVELATRLGLVDAELIESATRPGSSAALALGIDRLARTPGLRAKLVLVSREIAPPPAFLRWWSPLARRGSLGLLGAYLWRFAWLLWHLGPSVHAWRRSRSAGS